MTLAQRGAIASPVADRSFTRLTILPAFIILMAWPANIVGSRQSGMFVAPEYFLRRGKCIDREFYIRSETECDW